ncbi:MAG: hypothetical protein ACT4TC_05485 [Myxococcaceae bacterium]
MDIADNVHDLLQAQLREREAPHRVAGDRIEILPSDGTTLGKVARKLDARSGGVLVANPVERLQRGIDGAHKRPTDAPGSVPQVLTNDVSVALDIYSGTLHHEMGHELEAARAREGKIGAGHGAVRSTDGAPLLGRDEGTAYDRGSLLDESKQFARTAHRWSAALAAIEKGNGTASEKAAERLVCLSNLRSNLERTRQVATLHADVNAAARVALGQEVLPKVLDGTGPTRVVSIQVENAELLTPVPAFSDTKVQGPSGWKRALDRRAAWLSDLAKNAEIALRLLRSDAPDGELRAAVTQMNRVMEKQDRFYREWNDDVRERGVKAQG